MAFLRVKNVNGQKYAYLVENKWYKRGHKGKGRGPRQKVMRYLGRVYSFDKAHDGNFEEFKKIENLQSYCESAENADIMRELVEWELSRHNAGADFTVDFPKKKVRKGRKEVSIAMNEGCLNSYTLARLLNFKAEGHNAGMEFAKAFVEAGIEVPKELFVGMFSKIYKDDLSGDEDG